MTLTLTPTLSRKRERESASPFSQAGEGVCFFPLPLGEG